MLLGSLAGIKMSWPDAYEELQQLRSPPTTDDKQQLHHTPLRAICRSSMPTKNQY